MDEQKPEQQARSQGAGTPPQPASPPENAVFDLNALSNSIKEATLRLSFLSASSDREELRALLERLGSLASRLEIKETEVEKHKGELRGRWQYFSEQAMPQLQQSLSKNGLEDVFRFHALLVDLRDALLGPPRSAADRETAKALLTQELSRLQHEVIRLLERGRRFERRIDRIRRRRQQPTGPAKTFEKAAPAASSEAAEALQALRDARDGLREAINLLSLRTLENTRLARERADAVARSESLRREVEWRDSQIDGFGAILEQARRRAEKFRSEAARSEESVNLAQAELNKSLQEADQRQSRIESLNALLEQERSRAEKLQAELARSEENVKLAETELKKAAQENELLRNPPVPPVLPAPTPTPVPVSLDALVPPDFSRLFQAALPPLAETLARLRQASLRALPAKEWQSAAVGLAQVQDMLKSGSEYFAPAPKHALYNPVPPLEAALKPWTAALRRRNVKLVKRYSSGLVPCALHPDRLRIAAHHLIRNAYEAMPRGGSLTVEVASVSGAVEIRFLDNGPGFPREVLDEPFIAFRPSPSGRLGLGLALVQQILLGFGGSVRIANSSSKGAAVILQLSTSSSTPSLA